MSKEVNEFDGKIAGLYDLEETLGSGHFAVVKLARHVFTGEKVAVKVIDKSKLDETSRAHLFQEVRCMKLVQHPNVVRLYEVIDTHTKLYLILELGDGGDLYDYIMRHEGGLTEEVARSYFRQIVKAISYCHRLHVVHRDLKPENVVFFEKTGTVKLTDFGFSNRFCPGQKLETSCGSLAYSAPEILLGDSYDAPAVDVWSLGVILYMLVCGRAPFQEVNDSETLTMIMDCKYTVPKHISEDCKNLIAKMLIKEPEKRASLEEIEKDKWLSMGSYQAGVETLPLVSREQVSEEHHNLIVNKMVNGKIATKEEILEALDKNEYNHISATYFLLAERKLRAYQQGSLSNMNTKSTLRVKSTSPKEQSKMLCFPSNFSENIRSRKCSIVQEEDDEDESPEKDEKCKIYIHCTLNRRGSHSEGRLSHVVHEKFPQLPVKSLEFKKEQSPQKQSLSYQKLPLHHQMKTKTDSAPVKLLTTAGLESKHHHNLKSAKHEQQLKKFHKLRTTSGSSSDASDDDSENKKKRVIKMNNKDNSFIKRRDGYDDSSDSQDPGGSSMGCGRAKAMECISVTISSSSNDENQKTKTTTTQCTGGKTQSVYTDINKEETIPLSHSQNCKAEKFNTSTMPICTNFSVFDVLNQSTLLRSPITRKIRKIRKSNQVTIKYLELVIL